MLTIFVVVLMSLVMVGIIITTPLPASLSISSISSDHLRLEIPRKLSTTSQHKENLHRVHHHNMYNTSNATHPHHEPHKKSWMALEVVDGLRNEDIVVFITGTGASQFKIVRER